VSGRTRSFAVLAAAIAVVGLAALIASRGSDPTRTLDERVHEIGAGLRCPVCLNLSVADSPSKLAGEMRSEIETQLRAGRSPDQIRAFFIDPDYARRGIGRAILDTCERAARTQGFRRFEMMATLPGVRLYQACGYFAEEHVSYPVGDGVSIPFVRMRKNESQVS